MKAFFILCLILIGLNGFSQQIVAYDSTSANDTLYIVHQKDSLPKRPSSFKELRSEFSWTMGTVMPYFSGSTRPATYLLVKNHMTAETGQFWFGELLKDVPCGGNEEANKFFKSACKITYMVLICRAVPTAPAATALDDGIYFKYDNVWLSFERIGWKTKQL